MIYPDSNRYSIIMIDSKFSETYVIPYSYSIDILYSII